MKSILLFLVLALSVNSFSQIKLNVYNEKTENGFKILADNNEFCPVSVKLELDLKNLSSSNGNNKIYIIPSNTKGFLITNLQIIASQTPYSFKTKTNSNYGDINQTNYVDYNYSLPFQTGSSFSVFQGYNGNLSHQNENSLDFTMPLGTEISAAREGTVIKVVVKNNIHCADKKCAEYNNYVLVYHNDGTFSKYVHLKLNGAVVKEGDVIKENDLIGYSGNVGWSTGPHLHFMAYFQRLDKVETIKTKFKINEGKESQILLEKNAYLKNY